MGINCLAFKKLSSSLIVRVIERVSSFINQALVCSESCLVSADTAQTDTPVTALMTSKEKFHDIHSTA